MDRRPQTEQSRARPHSAVKKTPVEIRFHNQELQNAFNTQRSQPQSFITTKRSDSKPPRSFPASDEKQPNETARPQKFALQSTAPSYRFAQPYSSKGVSSNRFWAESNDSNPVLGTNSLNSAKGGRPRTAYSSRPGTGFLQNRTRRDEMKMFGQDDYERDDSPPATNILSPANEYISTRQFPQEEGMGSIGDVGFRPYAFLSNVGGKQTSLKEVTSQGQRPTVKDVTMSRKFNTGDPANIMIFTNSNVDRFEKSSRADRPQTVTIHDINSRVLKTSNTTMSIGKTTRRPETSKAVLELPDIFENSARRPLTGLTSKSSTKIRTITPSTTSRIYSAKPLSGKIGMQGQFAPSEGTRGTQEYEMDDMDLDIKEDVGENDEFYSQAENIKRMPNRGGKPLSSKARPISGRTKGTEEFYSTFMRYTNFQEVEQSYPELFDRNERTYAATFARFGDLGYYSPIQRIGCYMQFSAKLKREHLDEIINLQQTITSVEKPEYEIPIQLAIIDELNLFQTKQKTGISTTFQLEDVTRQPITLSLYPEYFVDSEYDPEMGRPGETASAKGAEKYFNELLYKMNGNYDPELIGKDSVIYIDPANWTPKIRKQIDLSINRYKNYIYNPEHIKHSEISKFKKEWITNALSLINEALLKSNEEGVRRLFQEIFETYKISMKEAIIDYILRSPEERKRLNVTLIPRKVMTSAQRIVLEGGYSIRLYPSWHEFYLNARENMDQRLHCMDIVNSSILDWYEDFKNFSLFEKDAMSTTAARGYSLSIPTFVRLENTYRTKTISIMKHIFYRGAILILKKFKFFRRPGMLRGIWTFNGFRYANELRDTKDAELNYSMTMRRTLDSVESSKDGEAPEEVPPNDMLSENFFQGLLYNKLDVNCDFEEGFDNYSDIAGIDDLLDIRESSSYRVYSILTDQKINLEDNGYKLLEKEQRKNLRSSVAMLMNLLLRRMVEKSVDELESFVLSVPLYSSLKIEPKRTQEGTASEIPTERSDVGIKYLTDRVFLNSDEEFVLIQPDFMAIQDSVFPVLRIEMDYDEGLIFKETEYDLQNAFDELHKNIITAFDAFLNPEFTKIEIKNDREIESDDQKNDLFEHKRRGAIHTEGNFLASDPDALYSKFCEIIQLKEKQPKAKMQSILQIAEPEEDAPHTKYLRCTSEEFFEDSKHRIIKYALQHFEESKQSFLIFDQFTLILNGKLDQEKKNLMKKQFVLEEYKLFILLLKKYQALLEKVPDSIYFPFFEIDCEEIKHKILDEITKIRADLFRRIENRLIETMTALTDRYNEISNFVRTSTTTAEQVEAMERFLYELNAERISLKLKASDCFQKIMAILKLDYYLLGDTIQRYAAEVHEWPAKLNKELKLVEEKHIKERAELEEALKERRNRFENILDNQKEDVKAFEQYTELNSYQDYIAHIKEFESTLDSAQDEMNEITADEQKLFGFVTNFDILASIKKQLSPYAEMWKLIGEYTDSKKTWMSGSIKNITPTDVEILVKNSAKSSIKLSKTFAPNSLAYRVINEFKEDVQWMQEKLPVVEVLCNPGLKTRHWDQIRQVINSKFDENEGTMREILAKGVEKHLLEIESLSEQATKEWSLESKLQKMEKEWENLQLAVIPWKNSNVTILQGSVVEDIMIILDDHTIKAQTIRASPDVVFMEARAERWEKLMLYLQEVIDVWVKVQSVYLYLEPIFGSEDINKQMPVEAEKFQQVNLSWFKIMNHVEKDPLVLNIEGIPNLLANLQNSLKLIEEIQKGLNDYLETKRIFFPRFFFLSNEDLLNILAETKDPLLVQPHLKKCFEGIDELIFSNQVEILGMRSSEGEEVSFLDKISPREFKSNVEQWLVKVEDQMRLSLQKVTEDSLNDITKTRIRRTDWVRKWPGQVVICVSQTVWTFTMESRMEKYGAKGLTDYHQELNMQLEDIVNLVRGPLSPMERMTLGALVVIEVHAKDVVQELIKDQVSEVTSFEWLSQMRYYWVPETKLVNVRMITTSMDYGYEYLGNTGRLVITPLTDRCYRTLMSALQLNLGGAPEGPAGTGKTETTKDLAKALAMQCVVFNCGEGLNSHSMAKFFKGLASAGAWSCFDEFNRIELEVLSVVAQQIMTIQQAKTQQKEVFDFEDTKNLALRATCNVFITMNPGYAGRTELPDNLKALFRPVAMMVPDYALIAEISLYSYGFVDARNLARKIVATYKLCSEQLSSQPHYDYGMRAVKAVLTTSGQLKMKFTTEKEDVLMFRAICDVNLPKFLTQDLSLFSWIINDLFPGVKPPAVDYGELNTAINNTIISMNLQNTPNFKKKILQLYEMVNCRHGLMLVGPPFAGKTMCYRVLAKAVTEASQTGPSDEVPAHYHVISPKAITKPQLYGYSDPISKEWTEGILADIYRKCATSTLPDRHWLVFDGPVDAEWIEDMNTVLDDNKKLCLSNGESIAMSNSMTMMFEVADLVKASPATVSRCGMVYMEANNIGWWPIFQSWLQGLEAFYDQGVLKRIEDLFDALVNKCMQFVKNKCAEYQPAPDANLVQSLMRLLQAYLASNKMLNRDIFSSMKIDDFMIRLDMFFLEALIWSIGAVVVGNGRKLFDNFFRKLIADPIRCEVHKERNVKLEKAVTPPESTALQVQDYYIEDGKWKSWKEKLEKNEVELKPEMHFHDIVVPTIESMRMLRLLQLAISNEFPFLMIGPTGTGKSLFIGNQLKSLSVDKYLVAFVTFSAQTTANQTQDIIDNRLEKRRKGVFGPPFGKRALVFVDDLNMPSYDKYGAQPPVELLRQYLDHGGWYDRKDRRMKEIIETSLIAAMGPPGGGKNIITSRFLRHFYIFATAESDEKTYLRIFNVIIDWHTKKNDLNVEISKSLKFAVEGTIEMYTQICENLKPTPAKSHYLFNLRDISRVVEGMLMLGHKEAKDTRTITRLWMHEVARVFYDRLTTESDQVWFFNVLNQCLKNKLRESDVKALFKESMSEELYRDLPLNHETLKYIRFGDLLSDEPSAVDRAYSQITEYSKLYSRIETFLEEYNSQTKRPMKLVLFEFAIDHILRICRILKMSKGHALLVGLGGSGRQSLTAIASYICEYELQTVEVTKSYNFEQWRTDMKKVIQSAGVDGKYNVFMINDSQIKGNYILEDINNLLNSGDIPNLFSPDEFIPFMDKLRIQAKKENRDDLINSSSMTQFYDYFIENVGKHLHCVLVLSSIGDSLRTRIRMFPSLINCCTYIYYKPWPADALVAVAQKFVAELELDDHVSRGVVQICKYMHESTKRLSEEYLKNENRYNYITPTSYLQLLSSLSSLMGTQRKKLEGIRDGYKKGVEKLMDTAVQVKDMQKELESKQPFLIKMEEETSILAEKIEKDVKAMEPKKKQVEEQEAMVSERVKEAGVIKAECETELAKALPDVENARKALEKIDPNDINMLKAMGQPPATVRLVMEAVCIITHQKPVMITNPDNPKVKIASYWETSKKLLANQKKFIESLMDYDLNSISQELMEKIRKDYVSRTTEFNPKRVAQASSAAKGLCEWVLALNRYEKVLAIVRPKQERYNIAVAEVEALEKDLKATRDELAITNAQLKELENQYDETMKKQMELKADIELCEKKLGRAETLIGSLGGERDRWVDSAEKLDNRLRFLIGDILLSAGTISYLGPFSSIYRNKCQKEWIDKVRANSVEISENYSLEACLGEAILIRKWTMNGLPSDSFSRENGIIIENSGRFALAIDPQNQANKWLKNNEQENGLKIVKQTDADFQRNLENAVQFGWPLLVESVGEELDPALEPALMRQTFKSGGVLSIKIGDNIVEYNKNFRIYLTTKLPNPHFPPETSTKISLVIFTITKEGLDDQLLEIAVTKEKPELEEQRSKLIVQGHENRKQLEEIEKKILAIMQTSQGNILDDEQAIEVLSQSKNISKEIEEKQKIASETEEKIEQARLGYRPISNHSNVLFFATVSLSNIEVMYQYSLNWFIQLYLTAFDKAETSEFLQQRVQYVSEYITSSVYQNVCRSLFEKDKLLFSFILNVFLLQNKNKIRNEEYTFFISPFSTLEEKNLENPLSAWLPDSIWSKFKQLSQLSEYFKPIITSLTHNHSSWKFVYDSPDTHTLKFPQPFDTATHMQRLCILKVLRPDKIIAGVREFIVKELGSSYISPPPFDINRSYSSSVHTAPLIFILPGTDPMSLLLNFSDVHHKRENMRMISLGQGQGVLAERAIEEARKSGGWVVLQNCHLSPSWMPKLEKTCEFLDSKAGREQTHPSFRLWLTSYPSPNFPVSILQNSIKMTNEPPKGLKSNLLVTYLTDPIADKENFFENHPKPKEFKSLLFGLCLFHAVIQERRNFGPIGWNIYYDFNQTDLRISVRQLHLFLNDYDQVPYKALHYLTGECNYGGRVTDDRDRRILRALMDDFFSEELLKPGYRFAGLKDFKVPEVGPYEAYTTFIEEKLPGVAPPSLYGFHPNAEISKDLKETNDLTYNLLKIGGGSGGSAAAQSSEGENEAKLKKICDEIMAKLPRKFETTVVNAKFPVSYNNSMNTVLNQEVIRYNNLTALISSTLINIDQALKGTQVVSEQLEKICTSLLKGLVPDMWKEKSYPSLKPLGSYIADLVARLQYLQSWLDVGQPKVFWVSGFFFTQSFLTGILQNYSRKHQIPIDTLTFDFDFFDEPTEPETLNNTYTEPEEGCYIYGLYLEGCRWDFQKGQLAESLPKVLTTLAPIIWLRPVKQEDVREFQNYKCPVYKTSERKGTLSTTGHSTNFIMNVNMNSDQPESHWIKRGVALICTLSE